jgi:hypothetical protein
MRLALEPRAGLGPGVRASDEERERTAASLQHHYAAGRLEAEELEERMQLVVAARTRGELRRALADLPSDRGYRALSRFYRFQRTALNYHAGVFVAGNGALVGIYELAGGGAFWPALVLAPTTTVLAAHAGGSRLLRRALRLDRQGRRPDGS